MVILRNFRENFRKNYEFLTDRDIDYEIFRKKSSFCHKK